MGLRDTEEVARSLRNFLSPFEGSRQRQPSLALIERALLKHGPRGIDDVPASVLRHAGRSLDAIDLDAYGPGLVLARRRIEQILRRRHGDRVKPAATEIGSPLHAGHFPAEPREFSDSLTVFIEIEALIGPP